MALPRPVLNDPCVQNITLIVTKLNKVNTGNVLLLFAVKAPSHFSNFQYVVHLKSMQISVHLIL